MAFPIPAAFVYCLLAGTLVLTDDDISFDDWYCRRFVFVVFSNEDDDDDGGGEDAS